MTTVALHPGHSLQIITKDFAETKLGRKEVDVTHTFSYDELIEKLNTKQDDPNRNPGRVFSKRVSMSLRALVLGKWPSEVVADKDAVCAKVIEDFKKVPVDFYKDLTDNAKVALVALSLQPLVQQKFKSGVDEILTTLQIDTAALDKVAKDMVAGYQTKKAPTVSAKTSKKK